MKTIQIRLTESNISEIDEAVKNGYYASRSDAIRNKLTELESIKETLEILSDPKLVESIERGIKDAEEGRTFTVKDLDELWE